MRRHTLDLSMKGFPQTHPTTTTLATPILSDFFYVWLRRSLQVNFS